MLQRIRQGCAGGGGGARTWGRGHKLLLLFVLVIVVFLAAVAAYADLINLAVGLARCPGNPQLSWLSLSRLPFFPNFDALRLLFFRFGLFQFCFSVIMRRQWNAFFCGCIKNC